MSLRDVQTIHVSNMLARDSVILVVSASKIARIARLLFTSSLVHYLTIRLRARVFYEQIVNEAQPSCISLVENEGE